MMRVLVCTETNLQVLDVCGEATPAGGCPKARPGTPVRCAGLQLVVEHESQETLVLAVEPDATACPLASLDLVPSVPRQLGRSSKFANGGD